MRLASSASAAWNGGVTKSELRTHLTGRLRAFNASDRDAASVAILRAIIGQRAWEEAKLVCAFLPLASEPQIAALWEREGGPSWCFPRSRGGEVELVGVNDSAALRRATWKMD